MLRMTWKVGVNGELSASWQVLERFPDVLGTFTPATSEFCLSDPLAIEHTWQVCTGRRAHLNVILGRSITRSSDPNDESSGTASVVGNPAGMNVWEGFTVVFGGVA